MTSTHRRSATAVALLLLALALFGAWYLLLDDHKPQGWLIQRDASVGQQKDLYPCVLEAFNGLPFEATRPKGLASHFMEFDVRLKSREEYRINGTIYPRQGNRIKVALAAPGKMPPGMFKQDAEYALADLVIRLSAACRDGKTLGA